MTQGRPGKVVRAGVDFADVQYREFILNFRGTTREDIRRVSWTSTQHVLANRPPETWSQLGKDLRGRAVSLILFHRRRAGLLPHRKRDLRVQVDKQTGQYSMLF